MGLHYPRKKVNKMWATLLAAMVLGSGGCHYGWKNSIREHYSFQSSQYYDCPHCGEVVSKAHFHDCRCNGAPGCYGYQATCWRAWPQGCDKCPPPGAQQPCEVPSIPYALPVETTPVAPANVPTTVPGVSVPSLVPNSVIVPPAQPEPIPQTPATVPTPAVESPSVQPTPDVPQPSPPMLPTPAPGSSGQNKPVQPPTIAAPTIPDFAVAPSTPVPPVEAKTIPEAALPVQAIPEPPQFTDTTPPAKIAPETSADLEKTPSAVANMPTTEPRVELTETKPGIAQPALERQAIEAVPQPKLESAQQLQPPKHVQHSLIKPSFPSFIPAQPKPSVAKTPTTQVAPQKLTTKTETTQEPVRTAQRSPEPTKATNAPSQPLKAASPKPQKSVLKPVQNLKPVVPAQLPAAPVPPNKLKPTQPLTEPSSTEHTPTRDAVAKKYEVKPGVIESKVEQQSSATAKQWVAAQPKAIVPPTVTPQPQLLPPTSLTPPTFSNTSLKLKVVEEPRLVSQTTQRVAPTSVVQPEATILNEEPQLAPIVKPADLKPVKPTGLQAARVDVVEPVRR